MKHLGRVLAFGGVVALLLAFVSSDVAVGQKKKDKDKDKNKYPAATEADYKYIQKQKELTGKLVSMDGKNVTIRAEYNNWEANPKYRPPNGGNPNSFANRQAQMWRTMNNITRDQAAAVKAKTPAQYQQAMNRVNNDMMRLQQEIVQLNQQMAKANYNPDPNNQPFVQKTNSKDFDLELQEKVVFRKMVLPFEYDDMGKAKTYGEKEKADLRGDDKSKPGYIAKIEDFTPGDDIKLHLTPPKKEDKPADTEKDKDAPPEPVQRPTVNMVVLTKANAAPGISGGTGDEKKKKKN